MSKTRGKTEKLSEIRKNILGDKKYKHQILKHDVSKEQHMTH